MPKQIFPKGQPLVRFDTRVLKSTHYDLLEIAKQKNLSLNQVVNAALDDYIGKNKKS